MFTWADLEALHRIESRLSSIEKQGTKIMSMLDVLQAAVAAEDTVVDSAIALLNGLSAQIAALTPDQAAIDALAADVKSKTPSTEDPVLRGVGRCGIELRTNLICRRHNAQRQQDAALERLRHERSEVDRLRQEHAGFQQLLSFCAAD